MTASSPEQGELYQKTTLPFTLATIYLGLLTFAAFFSRKIVHKLVPRGCLSRTIALQAIATIQICAGFYEEPVLKSVSGNDFFVFSFLNFYAAGTVPNSLHVIERLTVKRKGNSGKVLNDLFAQLFGALMAPAMVLFLWRVMAGQTNRPDLVDAHTELLGTGLCQWKFEFPSFCGQALTQFLVAVVMRYILTMKPVKGSHLAVSFIYATYFMLARETIGFPGFDPVHSLARVSLCPLGSGNFVKWTFCYVFAPIAGWLCFPGSSSNHVENVPNTRMRPNRRRRPHPDQLKSMEEAKGKQTKGAAVKKEMEEELKQEKVAIIRKNREKRKEREGKRKSTNHQGRNHKKP